MVEFLGIFHGAEQFYVELGSILPLKVISIDMGKRRNKENNEITKVNRELGGPKPFQHSENFTFSSKNLYNFTTIRILGCQ